MSDDAAVTVSNAELHLNACLRRRDRRVIVAGELSTHQVDAIRMVRIPDQYAHLDEEIEESMNATINLNSILSKALFDGTSA